MIPVPATVKFEWPEPVIIGDLISAKIIEYKKNPLRGLYYEAIRLV